MDRRVRGACPFRYVRQAEFKLWISEQQREDLALLLRAHDGQERWRGSSIHKMNNTLQFADTSPWAETSCGVVLSVQGGQIAIGWQLLARAPRPWLTGGTEEVVA